MKAIKPKSESRPDHPSTIRCRRATLAPASAGTPPPMKIINGDENEDGNDIRNMFNFELLMMTED